MGSLGSFGDPTPQPVEEQTFDYFGADLRVNPELTDADMLDFLEESGSLDEGDPKAALALKNFMRRVFLEDFDRFWTLARQHRQSIDQRMAAAMQIIEALADHPTGRSAGSSGGPPQTGVTLPVDFALAVQRKLEAQGRPDLAVAPLRVREAQARSASG